jgi:inorganic triphosphatase YgiF
MPVSSTETELKLRLAPGHAERIRRSAVLANSVCTEIDIDNVYFDTADRLLHRNRIALRIRQIGRRWLQTVKAEGDRGGVLSRRGEWETPVRVVQGHGRLDLARLSDSPLPALLAKQKRQRRLVPVFSTQVRRAQWLVESGDAVIEVALDIGEINVDGAPELRQPICEVELELKQGEPGSLFELALALLDIGGKAPPALIPVVRSKAEQGYQLAAQEPAPAVKASAKGFVQHVNSRSTTAYVLRAVIERGLRVLTANIESLLQHDDPEYVHQSRVALRRVRSAIRLFDPDHRDVPRWVAHELRRLARALGKARDWDVITEETLPSLADAVGAAVIDPLVVTAAGRREKALANVRDAAHSARYCALVLSAERWCTTPSPQGASLLANVAEATLASASKKMFKQGRFFAALTAPRRHRVRILAKRLRYALDLFAVVLPKPATARYIEALSDLQDALGLMNDASVAAAVLPQLTKSARARRSVHDWLASTEPARVHEIEARLLALAKLEAPWLRAVPAPKTSPDPIGRGGVTR